MIALAILLSSVSAAPVPVTMSTVLKTCRGEVNRAWRTGSTAAFDRYVARMFANEVRNRDEIIACLAYVTGAMDVKEGVVAELQEDPE